MGSSVMSASSAASGAVRSGGLWTLNRRAYATLGDYSAVSSSVELTDDGFLRRG
jgi:hypothetical protein